MSSALAGPSPFVATNFSFPASSLAAALISLSSSVSQLCFSCFCNSDSTGVLGFSFYFFLFNSTNCCFCCSRAISFSIFVTISNCLSTSSFWSGFDGEFSIWWLWTVGFPFSSYAYAVKLAAFCWSLVFFSSFSFCCSLSTWGCFSASSSLKLEASGSAARGTCFSSFLTSAFAEFDFGASWLFSVSCPFYSELDVDPFSSDLTISISILSFGSVAESDFGYESL